jgi:3-phenylpropionate/cinnamic acid dioxygenase small subunit
MKSIPENMQRQFEVEQYYYNEAQLLDEHRLDEWFALFTDDIRYWVPSRANQLRQSNHDGLSSPGALSLFDDNKRTLGWRVRQQSSISHWSENPRSRTRHLISNVRIAPTDSATEIDVRSNFLCYRNRMQDEVDIWAGERLDLLRRTSDDDRWSIARRTVILDQSVVLSKNLSVFF